MHRDGYNYCYVIVYVISRMIIHQFCEEQMCVHKLCKLA